MSRTSPRDAQQVVLWLAFLGGLVNYVINDARWQREPFFRDYVVHYTNAPVIVAIDDLEVR